MTAARPHHLSAPTIDMLLADVHAESVRGLVDLYADDTPRHCANLHGLD
jgi:hypothetical protein